MIQKKSSSQGSAFFEFDLGAVSYCPSTNAKPLFYYKRYLVLHNFTVLDIGSNKEGIAQIQQKCVSAVH
jgi:hypothetical protein